MASQVIGNTVARLNGIRTPEDLRVRLRNAWRPETSFTPDDWSAINPATGQCAVTALVVQDLFGGDLLRGHIVGGSHYWNRLPDGQEIDLTAEQFMMQPVIGGVELRLRGYVLSFPATSARYHQLRVNLGFASGDDFCSIQNTLAAVA